MAERVCVIVADEKFDVSPTGQFGRAGRTPRATWKAHSQGARRESAQKRAHVERNDGASVAAGQVDVRWSTGGGVSGGGC